MYDTVSCSGINSIPSQLPNIISSIFNGIKIVVPIVLIIMCMIDLAKEITKGNNFEIKEALGLVKGKLILCIIIFLVPSLVQFIVSFSGDTNVLDCVDLFLNGTSSIKEENKNEVITLKVGDEFKLNKSNTYISSNTTVATVKNGVVYALLEGSVTITNKDNNNEKYYIKIIDDNYVYIKKIRINNTTNKLVVGDSLKLNIYYEPSDASNKEFRYESLDDSIISVDSSGNIYAKKIGKTTITVISDDGIKASKEFTVINNNPESELKELKYKDKEINIYLDELNSKNQFKAKEFQLEIIKKPLDSNNKIEYEVFDNTVATVDSNGKITAKKEGETTIVVASDNGLKLEIPLIVKEVATKDTLYTLVNQKIMGEYNNGFNEKKIIVEQLGLKGIDIDIKVEAYLKGNELLSYYNYSRGSKKHKVSSDLINYEYSLGICETKEQTEVVEKYLNKVALTLTKECNGATDKDYCKLYQIRNWITKNMIYGKLLDEDGVESGHCAYNTIYKRKTENGYVGVCHAYSSIFYIMANAVGVKTKMVPGHRHVWNISLVNGKWYYSDITWDDVKFDKTTDSYYYKDKYFLIGEKTLKKTHSNVILEGTLVDDLDGYPISKDNYIE